MNLLDTARPLRASNHEAATHSFLCGERAIDLQKRRQTYSPWSPGGALVPRRENSIQRRAAFATCGGPRRLRGTKVLPGVSAEGMIPPGDQGRGGGGDRPLPSQARHPATVETAGATRNGRRGLLRVRRRARNAASDAGQETRSKPNFTSKQALPFRALDRPEGAKPCQSLGPMPW